MSEVYLAKDLRLSRLVAIKLLPSELTAKPKLRERFQVEARAISALSHPNICRLYDVGQAGNLEFLVLEHLEGETLSDRLDRGPLPLDESLEISIRIAEALDHAHALGVLHRDIKPSNIMLTKDGPMLMDFGVAKLLEPRTDSPTLTEAGKIVGTYDYMSPEQLEGRKVDVTTDIFSFGAVMYEMATGQRALRRHTVGRRPASLSRVLAHAADGLERVVLEPPAFRHVVDTCLAENPQKRWQSAQELANELRSIQTTISPSPEPVHPVDERRNDWRLRVPVLGLVALGGLALVFGLITLTGLALKLGRAAKNPSASSDIQFTISLPDRDASTLFKSQAMIATSPDARNIAFVVNENGKANLWLRRLSEEVPVRITDTEGATYPFWSPDSQRIGFFAKGKLRVIPIAASVAEAICDAPDGRGGTWNSQGTILFSPNEKGGLYTVSLDDRRPKALTRPQPTTSESHRWPTFLPDGAHFLYTTLFAQEPGIYLGSLNGSPGTRLLPDLSNAAFSPPGFLLFARDKNLIAKRFDYETRTLSGPDLKIAERITIRFSYASFAASGPDLIAYSTMGLLRDQMFIYRRNGRTPEALQMPEESLLAEPAASPDGRLVLLDSFVGKAGNRGRDIWSYEMGSGRFFQITKSGSASGAVWNPGSNLFAFAEQSSGVKDLYLSAPGAADAPRLLYHSSNDKSPLGWSHDQKYLVFDELANNNLDLWVLPLDRKVPYKFLATPANETHARISPDDRWIAYSSDESGLSEVYVTRFPEPGGERWRISAGGGDEPEWDPSGRTLYYIAPPRRLVAVSLRISGTLAATSPDVLFDLPLADDDFDNLIGKTRNYAMLPDGVRFLVRSPTAPQETGIKVLLHAHVLEAGK
jgi:serine/threonine protein kinase